MRLWIQKPGVISILGWLCMGLAGCATPVAKPASDTFVDRSVEIVVASPLIEYRDVHTNNPIEATVEDRERVETAVGELVRDQVKANGFAVRFLTADERALLPRDATGWLLCDESAQWRLLCLRGRFYVGPGVFYNPFSGEIKRGGSRLVLEARLLSGADHRLLWAQTAQVRETTGVSRGALKEIVEVLFTTLKAR